MNYDPLEEGWQNMELNDDGPKAVDSGIVFDFFGRTFIDPEYNKTEVYINDNGSISFGFGVGGWIPLNFTENPGERNMIAPFWADVDITDDSYNVTNTISWRTDGERFTVVWNEVTEYHATQDFVFQDHPEYATDNVGLTNTFEVVISDVNSNHPKICFCYCKMEWAHADAFKKGAMAVPPYQATVGIDTNDHADSGLVGNPPSWILAQFNWGKLDDPSDYSNWDGFGTESNGVQHLAGRSFCFDPSIVFNPPDVGQLSMSGETVGICGDPHFKTWKNEHFEYHGQCDLVVAKDPNFADGLGLDVHIRTKLVRFWSYIKNAVIRIGDDILEIEGSSMEGIDKEVHYWFNYEYQGELTEFAGFPVTFSSEGTKTNKNYITIDLSSKYPGQKITLSTFKEFVKVDFGSASAQAFGNTVGILGDFNTGKTLARDGATILDDFTELGHEWQVLPSDGKFFRTTSDPQFPKKCIEPENPRGERRRRLGETTVSLEQAEAACAQLKSALDRKDCVYDILATQDLDMAGAF